MPAYAPRHAADGSEPRYRGRHRAPSTTTRALTIGGTGVGAVAVSVIAPTAAHAATASQWDAVAACESGGNWAIDTGNGYYGGLQFAASTWNSYGGTAFAPLANEATAAEQMEIADRVLASQGWGAWPACSVEAGVAGTPTTTTQQTTPATTTTTTTTTSTATTSTAPSVNVKPIRGADYVVQPGDTLISIAAAAHVKGGWAHLYQVNRRVIGDNPSLIEPGTKLRLHPLRDRASQVRMAAERMTTSH
jgi:LysM repeat protein